MTTPSSVIAQLVKPNLERDRCWGHLFGRSISGLHWGTGGPLIVVQRRSACPNPSATIELERDALGRVIAEITNGTRVESEIDCCGRRVKRTIGDQVVDYTYDGMGRLTKWQLEGHDPLSFERNALGLETRRANTHGFDFAQSWDAVGQLEEQTGNSIKRAYEWSNGYDPKAIKDGRWGEKRYDYDPNGQITKTKHGDRSAETFSYNKDLNLSGTGSEGGEHDQFLNWQTSAAGVVRIARGPKGEAVQLEHDVNGRVVRRRIEQKGFRPKEWAFEWNAQDQLIRAHCPDGAVWTYEYDPFGRRIAKKTKDAETRFIWDGDVVAIESVYEEMRQTEVAWFYEPNSFRPLARQANGELLLILNDHLGTPKEIVEPSGRIRWAADHDTWGTVRACRTWRSPSAQPDEGLVLTSKGDIGAMGNTALARQVDPDPLLCPIRFQGQWEDAETGLYYNRFRYYEPMVGVYSSADPIGIWGGLRSKAYAINPSSYMDVKGLQQINLDTGILRGLTLGDSNYQQTILNQIGGRQPVVTQTVWNEYNSFLSREVQAGRMSPNDAVNARGRLSDMSARIPTNNCCLSGVAPSRKIGQNDIDIFGTGESLGIPTLTTDARAVRTLNNRGIPINAEILPPY